MPSRNRPFKKTGCADERCRCTQVAGFPDELGRRIYGNNCQEPYKGPGEVRIPSAIVCFSLHNRLLLSSEIDCEPVSLQIPMIQSRHYFHPVCRSGGKIPPGFEKVSTFIRILC
jgi:hypothetical protein